MKYGKARAIVESAIEQLDELTDAEMEKLEKEHEARMAKQERTAYMSPTLRYHVERLRRLAKPAAKKRKGKKIAEAIEQIDELSKGTYGSYIKKATRDIHDRAYDATPIAGDPQHDKIRKRIKGIDRAVKALGGQHRGAGNKKALGEGTKRVARLRAAREKALSKGKKVGSIAKAEDRARQKYQRSERKRELKPGAIENRMKWQKKYPGPSQPRGFGSYGF